MSAPRLLLLSSLLALCGCEFFGAGGPGDEAAADGVLACGETMSVDGLTAADDIDIDAPAGTGLEIRTDFEDLESGARLELISDSGNDRRLEFWDALRGIRVITARIGTGQEARLDLLGRTEFRGTVSLSCENPGEDCGDVVDNDGDGAVDCADLTCARDPGCVEDQRDFDTLRLACTDGWEPVEVDEIASFSDQRTLYQTAPGEVNEPIDEFWGGAEIVVTTAPVDRFVQLRFAEPGMLCGGIDNGTSVGCSRVERLAAGDITAVATADLPVWVEPLGAAWVGLEARVDCGQETDR